MTALSPMAQVVYYDALQHLVIGAILLGTVLIAIGVLWRLWRWHRRDPESDIPLIWGFLLALLSFFLLVLAMFYLADIWNWIPVFGNPQLAVLHQQLLKQCSGHRGW